MRRREAHRVREGEPAVRREGGCCMSGVGGAAQKLAASNADVQLPVRCLLGDDRDCRALQPLHS
jgi:hypothetical protein